MTTIPKVGVHLGALGFIPCTLPHLWKCVSHLNTLMKHTFNLMGPYTSHFVTNPMLGLRHWGTNIIVDVHCVIEVHCVVVGVDHVVTNVHCAISVHRVCLFFQILSLLFIMLYSPFVVSTTPIPTLSCKSEFHQMQKVSGYKALTKAWCLDNMFGFVCVRIISKFETLFTTLIFTFYC